MDVRVGDLVTVAEGADFTAVAGRRRIWAGAKKVKIGRNFLYPGVFFVTSNSVGSRVHVSVARRTLLQGGSEENQCQRL